jgi:hypothetical protein
MSELPPPTISGKKNPELKQVMKKAQRVSFIVVPGSYHNQFKF